MKSNRWTEEDVINLREVLFVWEDELKDIEKTKQKIMDFMEKI